MAVRVGSREVQEIYAGENDEETCDEGDRVDRVGGVKTSEEDEGGDENGRGEGHVVDGTDTARSLGERFFEEIQKQPT